MKTRPMLNADMSTSSTFPTGFGRLSPMQYSDHPFWEDIANEIWKRHNKAPEEDSIHAEIHKPCVDALAPWLHEMVQKAWVVEVVPHDWGSAYLRLSCRRRQK
uniref:Uncharacterized protein n=1 Tax=Schistocephalus solidus TaxID=70667 RepID=A0A0X3P0H8_SCHSO